MIGATDEPCAGRFWATAAVFLTFALSHQTGAVDEASNIRIIVLGNVPPFAGGLLLGVLAILTARNLTPDVHSFRLVSSIWLVAIAVCLVLGVAATLLSFQRQGGISSSIAEFLFPLVDVCTKVGLGLLAAAWIKPNAASKT